MHSLIKNYASNECPRFKKSVEHNEEDPDRGCGVE